MHVVLISTYELGRQPFGLASPAAWLRRAGAEVRCLDLSREPLDEAAVHRATLVAFHLPMHTATRLAVPVMARVRALRPDVPVAAYGVYSPPNAAYLRSLGVTWVLGPEAEADLVRIAGGDPPSPEGASVPRLELIQPDRSGLPSPDRYATLQMPTGERRRVGYTEATRGCKHLCRHCPIVPVYNGQFRVVPVDVVLADVRAQVEAGAQHITFGDPDFLNGPTHAVRVVRRLAAEFPGLTYDVVIKIEHILGNADVMETLRDTGCLFVTSAVESVDDGVLQRLRKGHTTQDFFNAASRMRTLGLPLVPTFVPFTPWTTVAGYLQLLAAIEQLDLVEHVAPIQLAIRLLLPAGSPLADDPDVQRVLAGFDQRALAHTWVHADHAVDLLQRDIVALVGRRLTAPRAETFEAVRARALQSQPAAAATPPASFPRQGEILRSVQRSPVPYMNEPWYC